MGAAVLVLCACPLASASNLYEERSIYRAAVHSLTEGRGERLIQAMERLRDYPLYPYLRYYDAERRLSSISPREMQSLRVELADIPAMEVLYRTWLNRLASRGQWAAYLANYEPTTDVAGQCNYLRALYRSGKRKEALDQVRPLWLSPVSLPETCDPLFEAWISARRLNEGTVWQRIRLALGENELDLARYLASLLSDPGQGRSYIEMHQKPSLARNLDRYRNSKRGRDILAHGFVRLSSSRPEEALALFRQAREKFSFDKDTALELEETLLIRAVGAGMMVDRQPDGLSPETIENIAHGLLEHQYWKELITWINAMPEAVRGKVKWRYWLGRALIDSNENAALGTSHLQDIAPLRTYYGFLAADRLDMPPAFNERKPVRDEAAQRELLAKPEIVRMFELFAVGDEVNARREWQVLFGQLGQRSQGHLIERADIIGWQSQAIFGAFRAELRDLLEIRFPTPYLNIYRRHAFQTDNALNFVYAITRQESAFDARAISSSGAHGLMQVMPATGGDIARRLGIDPPSNEELLDPLINVRLGTHYLSMLSLRYSGHRALIAAAYNAGPSRADRWRDVLHGIPTDVWIERIPFYETQNYVKNVLAFDLVYAHRLGKPIPVFADHERRVP